MPPTYCLNCNCMLSNNRAIEEHLKYSHGIQMKLNAKAHQPAYCHCCHKFVGHKGTPCPKKDQDVDDFERRRDWEKHLFKDHDIFLYQELEPQQVVETK